MDRPVVVIGGTGRLGRLLLPRLHRSGRPARAVGRGGCQDPARLPGRSTAHTADVRDPDSLVAPLHGCGAVVFCVEPGTAESGPDSPEATMYEGVRNVLDVLAAAAAAPRFVLVSQILVTRRDHPMNAYGRLLDWRMRGEDAVRASGLPYTVVRPGWLTDVHDPGERVRLEQGDRGEGWVSRESVAEACVQSLRHPTAVGRTFELYNEPGPATTDWLLHFARLAADPVLTARAAL
ncbi:NAD(P)H-binding protein [Kitasatospora sp. NPDC088391]|uniref:NAD(P)H-binding protein n=1 Tax=Kitasatospora sp. NPDC088391 TaxID=3364074 RepID=UPI0037FC61B3